MFDIVTAPIGWIFGILHFVLVVYGLMSVLGSSMSLSNKLLWIVVIIAFPVVGLGVYLLLGRD